MENGVFTKFTVGSFYGEPILQFVNSIICNLRLGLGVKVVYIGGLIICIIYWV